MKQLFGILTLWAAALPLWGQSGGLQALIEQELAGFPDCEVAIGLVEGGEEWRYGYRISNGSLQSVDNHQTLFEIASISKTFVAGLVAQSIERETLSLDDPLQKHLSFEIRQDSFQGHTLRMKHLVTHTSGLKRNPLTSSKGYAKYLKSFKLDYEPGTSWEYNNLTVDLVAEIMASAQGKTWPEWVKEQVFQPLGMENSYVHLGAVPETGRVWCLNKKGEWKDCYFHPIKPFQWPSGGIISNVEDMMKWLSVNMDHGNGRWNYLQWSHDPLEDRIVTPWFTRYRATQGVIWWHYRTDNGARIICHGGNSPRQTSFLAFDPKRQRGIVILANLDGRSLMNNKEIIRTTELAMKVLDQ